MSFIKKEQIKAIYQDYPITIIIVLISTLLFIIHISLGEYWNYSQESITSLGGLNNDLIHQGEIWRLFTYTFGHMSSVHFIINAPILLLLSLPLEKKYGIINFLLFFIVTTITAGFSIYVFYQGSFLSLAGLSGTGYGFAGMLTFLILKTPEDISKSYKIFIIIMLSSGVFSAFDTSHNIAISGHIGGFISGFLLALITSMFKGKNKFMIKSKSSQS